MQGHDPAQHGWKAKDAGNLLIDFIITAQEHHLSQHRQQVRDPGYQIHANLLLLQYLSSLRAGEIFSFRQRTHQTQMLISQALQSQPTNAH